MSLTYKEQGLFCCLVGFAFVYFCQWGAIEEAVLSRDGADRAGGEKGVCGVFRVRSAGRK